MKAIFKVEETISYMGNELWVVAQQRFNFKCAMMNHGELVGGGAEGHIVWRGGRG
jgi:hypothetical protein